MFSQLNKIKRLEVMSEQKREFREGEDGKLYYTYNYGAEYRFLPPFRAPFTYRIVNCELNAKTEKEYYTIESAGKILPTPFSVKTLETVLNELPYELIDEGAPTELPLIRKEILDYFDAKRKQLNAANKAENEKLKGTDYQKNLNVIKALKERLNILRSNGEDEAAEQTERKLAEAEESQRKLLSEKCVDVRILTKAANCKKCFDTGYVGDAPCECTYELADKIKAYNAQSRLNKRRLTI